MPPSDPFDDEDDFFNNAETLDLLAAVEDRATRASQVPKSSQAQGYHHTLAKPKKAPIAGHRQKAKDPGPLNTEPRAGNSGFGWEYGGKRSIEGNVERHLKAIDDRQAYWNGGGRGEEDDPPPDVVMGEDGRYGLGMADEAVVTDNRKAQQTALGESLGLAQPPPSQPRREVSAEAAAARRRAIAEAASGGPLPARPPLSRSNSASSSSSMNHGINRPSVALNNAPAHQQRTAPKFSANRSLSRSISAGGQVFHRPNAAAGPSRLPAIPSQIREASPHGSQGAPPASQGSAARQAAIELEQERRKRQELEAELMALRAQAAIGNQRPVTPVVNGGGQGQAVAGDSEKKVQDLQAEVWRAKGEAETMRRAQKEEHSRHLAEIEKLRAALADKDVQIKERETIQKRAVESIKHQAVFSNHAIQNSAMKNRQQSQRFGSSQRPQPTPLRTGSPSRQMLFDAEATPLARSVKGKGKAPPPPAPAFGGFSNAFAATPTVGARVKRQRTEALSPQPQPRSSPTKAPTPSPVQPSPTKSRNGASSPVFGDAGDGFDYVGEVQGAQMDLPNEDDDELMTVNLKAELLFHIFNHVAISSFQQAIGYTNEPTIYRIVNYRPSQHADPLGAYTEACSNLLKGCGGQDYKDQEIIEMVLEMLFQMLHVIETIIRDVESITVHEIAVLFNLMTLFSKTLFLFPALVQSIMTRNPGELFRDITIHLFSDQARLAQLREKLDEPTVGEADAGEMKDVSSWYLESADALVELCEAMTFTSESDLVWEYQQLVDIILYLTAPHQETFIVQRGVELFYTASCFPRYFRALIATSDQSRIPNDQVHSPLIERLSRWLINPFPNGTFPEILKEVLTILRGLCMMAISHPDAVILMGQRSILVYALILVLQRESTKIWGVHAELHSIKDALDVLHLALALLHHLVFPSPIPATTGMPKAVKQFILANSTPQGRRRSHAHSQTRASQADDEEMDRPIGINLADKIKAVTLQNEFNGLQHVFVSALGCMAYGGVGEDVVSESELRSLQFLAQDLLEQVIEGPEGDSIFEIYVVDDEEPPPAEGDVRIDDDMMPNEDEVGEGDAVDMDAYAAAMDVDEED